MNFTYILLSIIFFYLGINFSKKSLKLFLFITIAFPFLNLNTKFHVNYQIPIFIFFFLGGIIKKNYSEIKLSKNDLITAIVLIAFICYGVFTIPLYYNHEIINIIKDLKFVIFGFLLYIFILINDSLDGASLKDIEFFLKWNFIISIICFILMFYFDIHRFFNQDAYFEINEVRYMNYGTYIIPFYTLFILANRIKVKKYNWIYIIIPMLISGNRTIILLLIFVSLIILLKRLSTKKIVILFTSFFSLLLFVFFVITKASVDSPLFRFKKLFSFNYLTEAISTRLSPFYIRLESFEFYNYLIGKGLGFTYYIPWFHYRKDLDDYNIYLDSLIPTLYGKYGVFLLLPIFLFILYLRKCSDNKPYNYYLIFFILLSLTNSFLYQNYFIFVLFILYYLKSSKIKN